jgi:hypothetical protein
VAEARLAWRRGCVEEGGSAWRGCSGATLSLPWLGGLPRLGVALVAQLDRASDYGSEGWGFESLRARR